MYIFDINKISAFVVEVVGGLGPLRYVEDVTMYGKMVGQLKREQIWPKKKSAVGCASHMKNV